MIEFIASGAGTAMFIIILVILLLGYAAICIFEALTTDEFDPVCEAKCKNCICYDMCKEHGCHYECPDYMTEEELQKKGGII